MLSAKTAVLVHFKTVRIVFLVFDSVVIALFALCACHCDFNSHFMAPPDIGIFIDRPGSDKPFSAGKYPPSSPYCGPSPRCPFLTTKNSVDEKTTKKPWRGRVTIPHLHGLCKCFLKLFQINRICGDFAGKLRGEFISLPPERRLPFKEKPLLSAPLPAPIF